MIILLRTNAWVIRLTVVSLLLGTVAHGQGSKYVDMTGHVNLPQLQREPLPMSFFPTTFDMALTKTRTHLRTVDVNGKVWQWQLHPPPKPEQIASTESEPIRAVLSSDGELLAFADDDASVSLMHLESKEILLRDDSISANVTSLTFSTDNKQLAAVTAEGLACVWDLTKSKKRRDFRVPAGSLHAISIAPEGKSLAVASYSQAIQFFDLERPSNTHSPDAIEIPESRITAIAYSPNGKQIVVAAANGTAKVYDLADPTNPVALESHPFAVWSISFDEDGKRMIAGSWDGTTRIWDTDAWQLLQELKGHNESVTKMLVGGPGMVSAGLGGRLLYWPTKPPRVMPRAMIAGSNNPAWVCTFTPDGKRIFVGGGGQRGAMWNLARGEKLYSQISDSTTRCANFSPDSSTLAIGSDDRTVSIVSSDDGQIRRTFRGHRGPISTVMFADDGKTLVSGCDRGLVKFWDTESGEETASLREHKQQIYCGCISPNQKWLVTGGGHWLKQNPGELVVWDLENRQLETKLMGHSRTVWSIVFAPNGKFFAASDNAGDVIIWDTESWKKTQTLKHDSWLRPLAMSPDGKTLAVGRGDGPIQLWDTGTWKENGAFEGHDGFTFWLAYSPDGKTLASGGNDGSVQFWATDE